MRQVPFDLNDFTYGNTSFNIFFVFITAVTTFIVSSNDRCLAVLFSSVGFRTLNFCGDFIRNISYVAVMMREQQAKCDREQEATKHSASKLGCVDAFRGIIVPSVFITFQEAMIIVPA